MKNFKKISLGLGLAALFAVVFQFMSPGLSLAAAQSFSKSDWDNASYAMNKSSTIVVTFVGGGLNSVSFTDTAPNDSIHNYVADTNNTGVCSGSITFNSGQGFNDNPIAAKINVNYMSGSSPTCTGGTHQGANANYPGNIKITNNTSNGGATPTDTGPTTVTYNGTTYEQIENSRAYGADTDVNNCYGGSLVVLDAVPTGAAASGGVAGTILPTAGPTKTSVGTELSSQVTSFPKIQISGGGGKCYYDSNADNSDHTLLTVVGDGAATFAGCSKGDSACNGAPSTVSAAAPATPPANSCEGSSNTGFEWIFCGVLRMFDKAANTLNGIIEDLLNFDVKSYLNQDVHNAWSIFKNLASAILVIVLLVAVIAQALGGGPLDAYTIRKILPRLIIAVILMQISWYMLIWAIELANDLGHGMRDLLTAPFGGYSSLGLDKLVGQLGIAAPAGSEIAIFTTAGIAFAFSGITIGGMALIALSGVLSLIVGLLILLLREILIILCVILFPLAILAWILPGTQRYWKLWYDNFSKLLILFPLIMGVIYAGRIFAHIAGMPGGTGNHILAMFIVFVGYFAPYWFLPKTFKWGGQAFAAASSGVLNATKTARAYPRKVAMEGAHENREHRAEERLGKLAEGRSRFRRFDELLAGRYNVARSGETRVRHFEAERAKGREAAEKAVAQSIVGSQFERQTHQMKLADLTALAQGQDAPNSGIEGSSPVAQRWALDKLAEYGDWDIVSNLRSQGAITREVWEAFVAKNIGSIHQKAPHLSPLKPDLTALSAEEIPNFHGYTMTELEEQATHGVVRNAGTGMMEQSADPEEQRRRAVALANRVLETQHIASKLTQDQRTVLERIRNLGGPEMMFPRDPANPDQMRLAISAQVTYGRQIASGTLSPTDQDAFEDNVLNIKAQAATSTAAKEAFNRVINSVDETLARRVQAAEQQAISQGQTPAQVAAARSAAQAQASAERARLAAKGFTPLP